MCVWSTIGRRKTGRNLKATKPETLKLTSTTQGISSISTGCYHGCPDPLHKSHVNLGFRVTRSVFFVVCVCVCVCVPFFSATTKGCMKPSKP